MSELRAIWRVFRSRPLRSGPVRAASHHLPTLFGRLAMERWLLTSRALPSQLNHIAVLRAASIVDCAWCLDIGYAIGRQLGMSRDKIEAVADWPSSDLLSDDERLVAEYSDALSRTPIRLSDDLERRIDQRFSRRQRVALTNLISWEHARARFNAGLGLQPEGYAEVVA